MTMETLIMRLSNKTLHELGMIDDPTADDSTFAKMAEEYAVGRKEKYKNTRKYIIKNKQSFIDSLPVKRL